MDKKQIGWFCPASKRFCYTDEKEYDEDRKRDYTIPVYAIPDLNSVIESEYRKQREICAKTFKEKITKDSPILIEHFPLIFGDVCEAIKSAPSPIK